MEPNHEEPCIPCRVPRDTALRIHEVIEKLKAGNESPVVFQKHLLRMFCSGGERDSYSLRKAAGTDERGQLVASK